jgi:hypothetical protein
MRREKVRGGGFEEIDEVSEDPVLTQKLAVSDELKRGAWSRRGKSQSGEVPAHNNECDCGRTSIDNEGGRRRLTFLRCRGWEREVVNVRRRACKDKHKRRNAAMLGWGLGGDFVLGELAGLADEERKASS